MRLGRPWAYRRSMPNEPVAREICDVCGADRVVWRRCKLICEHCGTIVLSCADLIDELPEAGGAAASGRE